MQPVSLKRPRDIHEPDQGPVAKWSRPDMGEPIIITLKRKRFFFEGSKENTASKRIRFDEKAILTAIEALTLSEKKNHFQSLPDHLVTKILAFQSFTSIEESSRYCQTIEKVCRKWHSCTQKVKSGRTNEMDSNETDAMDQKRLNNALAYARSRGSSLFHVNLSRYNFFTDRHLFDLVSSCPNISTLILQDALISNLAFEIMANLPRLEILEIYWCDGISNPEALAKLYSLKKLVVSSSSNLIHLPDLDHFKSLEILKIDWCNKLACLPKLPPWYVLKKVRLNYCQSLENLNRVHLGFNFEITQCPKLVGEGNNS